LVVEARADDTNSKTGTLRTHFFIDLLDGDHTITSSLKKVEKCVVLNKASSWSSRVSRTSRRRWCSRPHRRLRRRRRRHPPPRDLITRPKLQIFYTSNSNDDSSTQSANRANGRGVRRAPGAIARRLHANRAHARLELV
jgi:hypothetical protein